MNINMCNSSNSSSQLVDHLLLKIVLGNSMILGATLYHKRLPEVSVGYCFVKCIIKSIFFYSLVPDGIFTLIKIKILVENIKKILDHQLLKFSVYFLTIKA